MKYLSVPTITAALHRIYKGGVTHEHRTGTATSGLLQHYFPLKKYIITPEQIQDSNKRPDFTVERLNNKGDLVSHVFVEIKSLVNSNFDDIMDQLYDTVLENLDNIPSNSTFVIAMKAGKIAFFTFNAYISELDDYGIEHYKGFRPLNLDQCVFDFFEKNPDVPESDYWEFGNQTVVTAPQDVGTLLRLGVESTSKIKHPHIWTLLNKEHENYVHDLFVAMGKSVLK